MAIDLFVDSWRLADRLPDRVALGFPAITSTKGGRMRAGRKSPPKIKAPPKRKALQRAAASALAGMGPVVGQLDHGATRLLK